MDRFVEQELLPAYTRGEKRRYNGAYHAAQTLAYYHRRRGHHEQARALYKAAQAMPSYDTHDPEYRRLRYIRYADDFLLGFAGPRQEAEEIKLRLTEFLHEHLKLELLEDKTVITHARTHAARFLGYEVHVYQCDSKRAHGRRSINGRIGLRVPHDVITEACQRYMKGGKPARRPELINDDDFTIIRHYQSTYRGLVNYYRMAYNLRSVDRLRWVMEQSLTKTVAQKHKLRTSKKVYERYSTHIDTEVGPRKVLQVAVQRPGKRPHTATWGGISLRWDPTVPLPDDRPKPTFKRAELLQRLLADTCALCGSHDRVQVHHIKHLRTLEKAGHGSHPLWVVRMVERRRKWLPVCHRCHVDIHAGVPKPVRQAARQREAGEPDDGKPSRPVRRGADGKVPFIGREGTDAP